MASKYFDTSLYKPKDLPKKEELIDTRIAIIAADWNSSITYALRDGAYDALIENGIQEKNVEIFHVPGAFELTYAASKLAKTQKVDAIIVIGCVIQGDTPHFKYVCEGVTQGITELNLKGDIPVIFSVLTTYTIKQARDRAGGCLGNKGIEGAITAIKMIKRFGGIK